MTEEPERKPDAAAADAAVTKIAVVGTGIAAVTCARMLSQAIRAGSPGLAKAQITLCTSRGKLATQMGAKNQAEPQPGKPFFDYGCQYFTACEDEFVAEVDRWSSLGLCQSLPSNSHGTISAESGFKVLLGAKCWVGNGGMSPMLKGLVQDLASEFPDILHHVQGFPDSGMAVKTIRKISNGWMLGTKGGKELGPFDLIVGGFAQHCLTDPFLMSGGASSASMLDCLRRVESNQLIVMQAVFEGEALPMNFVSAHVYGEEALSWICNNCGKPQQNGKVGTVGPQHLTLISTAAFAEREFNRNPKGYKHVAEEQMLGALARVLGIQSMKPYRPRINRINHWEDGLPTNIMVESRGCLFDVDQRLGWCGDFCVAPGIEGAAKSGCSMARVIAEYLQNPAAFNKHGLLPSQHEWLPISAANGMMDIGSFSPLLGLPSNITHTDLVPSALQGYGPVQPPSAWNPSKGKGKNRGKGGGKGSRLSA